jgi:hypothetical protein
MLGTWELFALTTPPSSKTKKKKKKKTPHYPQKTKKGGPFIHSMKPILIGCMEILLLNLAAFVLALNNSPS